MKSIKVKDEIKEFSERVKSEEISLSLARYGINPYDKKIKFDRSETNCVKLKNLELKSKDGTIWVDIITEKGVLKGSKITLKGYESKKRYNIKPSDISEYFYSDEVF